MSIVGDERQASQVDFTPESADALRLMEDTRAHVCITGRAGTGKSTLLRYFRDTTKKNLVVLAPTGIAAVHVGGQTIHAFFRLPPRFIERTDIRAVAQVRAIVERLDAVVIDEVSMVRADLIDGIDWALRLAKGRRDLPFGGVQMIFFGDLCQLPPVVDEEMRLLFEQRYASPYFFSADVFATDVPVAYRELTRIFRQTDRVFVALLDRIRDHQVSQSDLDELNARVIADDEFLDEDVVTLTATNRGAAQINRWRLRQLEEPAFEYAASATGAFEPDAAPADYTLVLKRGAQVMLLRNDPEKRWVNGSIGRVEALSPDSITVSVGTGAHDIPRERWEKIRYTSDPDTGKIAREVIGTFEQYPIKLAWAMTIHKSQGQTLSKVIIDMERGAFAHGQLYVALSRCTALSGIRLKVPVTPEDVIFDPRVLAFRQSRMDQLQSRAPSMT